MFSTLYLLTLCKETRSEDALALGIEQAIGLIDDIGC